MGRDIASGHRGASSLKSDEEASFAVAVPGRSASVRAVVCARRLGRLAGVHRGVVRRRRAGRGDADRLSRPYTGRTVWPSAPFGEAALIVGRRGGKSRILATIAVYLACVRDYAPYLAPGEEATIAVIAADRDQARSIFHFVSGLIKAAPMLRKMIAHATRQRILLANRVAIEI